MRTCELKRKTTETDIELKINIDGSGKSEIVTGCGFMDHMLTLLAKHSKFDLNINAVGDVFVDDHHTVEDIGILLGKAVFKALSDMRGIFRFADIILPMDESLVIAAVDISGRGYIGFDVKFPTEKIGTFDTELIEEFFVAFVRNANITLHIKKLAGENSHHIAEACFKALGRALNKAVLIDENFKDEIPSTKGLIV